MGLSLTDPAFAAIVSKPDNLPIVAMVYLLGFFTWLATAQAVRNDDRLARGLPPLEKTYTKTVLVWPDVVYLELIGCILGTVVLIVWSLLLRAPLGPPADPVLTPNPVKAPWYFVGLQEMLVYFPPWMAGVVLPALIVFGLMAIPYLDFNPQGNGYYTIRQRPFAYLAFQFGFLQLWVLLILIGTFLRGPNWSFYGRLPTARSAPGHGDDQHQPVGVFLDPRAGTEPARGAARQRRDRPARAYPLARASGRGALGVVLPGPAAAVGRHAARATSAAAWAADAIAILMLLGLTMLILPLKMVLVWTLHLNYLVSIPEYFFYF